MKGDCETERCGDNRNGEDCEIYICGNISIATVKIVAATALMCYILTTSHFTLNPCDLDRSI